MLVDRTSSAVARFALVFVVLWSVLVTSGYPAVIAAQPIATPAFQTYVDPQFGFSVSFPIGWRVSPGTNVVPSEGIWEVRFIAPETHYKALVISVQPVNPGDDAPRFALTINDQKPFAGGTSILQVGGGSALQTTLSGSSESADTAIVTYMTHQHGPVAANFGYQLVLTADQTVLSTDDRAAYNALLRSFVFGTRTPTIQAQPIPPAISVRAPATSFNFPFPSTDWHVDFDVHPSANAGVYSNCLKTTWENLWHAGEDLGNSAGTSVRAVANGTVLFALNNNYPGRVVIIQHTLTDGSSIYSMYGHLNSVYVAVNQEVTKGATIGTVLDQGGNSHVHWEMRYFADGTAICDTNAAGPGYTYPGHPQASGYTSPTNFVTSHQTDACVGPILTSPGDGYSSYSSLIGFTWNALSGCQFSGYNFRLKDTPNMDSGGNLILESTETTTSKIISVPAAWTSRELFWGVRGANASGGASWSVRRVRVDPAPYMAMCAATLSLTSPAFTRTKSGNPPTTLPTSGTSGYNVYYRAMPFTVYTTGNYLFEMTAASLTPSGSNDGYYVLYQAPFNPATPLTNALQAVDDYASGALPRLERVLTAGTNYVLVSTTFNNQDTGPLMDRISGAGPISGWCGGAVAPTATPTGNTPCTPGADQVAVFADVNYGGACAVMGIGTQANAAAMGVADDSVTSIKVGGNVQLRLCVDPNLATFCQIFNGNDPDLSTDAIGARRASSSRVERLSDVPAQPGSPYLIGSTTNSITLGWADYSTNETQFRIYRWDYGTLGWQFYPRATVTANQTTYTDSVTACNETDYYMVSAANASAESRWAGFLAASTQPCSGTATPNPARPDTIGVYRNGTWFLRNTNTGGAPDLTVTFGSALHLPVVGDWNGDGVDTVGVYNTALGTFSLSNSNNAPTVAYGFVLGNPGDTPIAGRWDATMTHDGTGVYRPSNGILYQKRELTSGVADFFAIFGNPGDYGVAGDWDGNGYDSVGIYRPGGTHWYMTNNGNPTGITYSDIDFVWPIGSAVPVVGDWSRSKVTTVGAFIGGQFTLHSANAAAGTDTVFAFGQSGDRPVAGKWVAAAGATLRSQGAGAPIPPRIPPPGCPAE